ncbi:TetR family transcriptional regulator [Vibrio anguillarum]|uniref:outer membrane beta-barrel protein n=1 Tax=Vibrio anguillarum TaxID=55601 RepID=UPI00188CB13B|nr:outer membrane beta-barrel protein [Vibrio anguillarum]MBF4257406.1 TetR family transcriptional regulator [Vibrio anguillarum]MBF4278537.1 TetR family transcriptional regulator [Vibrio anguillarum]MBF4300635.1 TetR family transcriptional regulator [Vibrio anguillarum]MBF4363607.1 TetR family transcriptional regulator [Vibrio anguillarum]MBF4398295.1 TetR family transcriptional regulator [Vibrio anguillarum]
MKTTNLNRIASFGLAFFALSAVQAKPQPNPIMTESGIAIVPFLNLSTGYNDNLAKASQDLEHSQYSVFEPGVGFAIEPANGQKYRLGYRLQRGDYFSSSKDNYTDHFFDLAGDWELSSKHRLDLSYNLALTHEQRGDNDTTLNLSHNEYNTNNINLGYGLGGEDAKGRLETNIGWSNFDYQNNKNITQYQNWDELRFNSAFYYKALPKTFLVFQFVVNDRHYDEIAPGSTTKDSKHYFTYVGTSWDATGKLQGSAKVGVQHKDYESSSREDFNSFSWDIDVTYLIRTYSAVQLKTNRKSTDTNGTGDSIDTKTYAINWSHNWSDIISSNLDYSLLNETYTRPERTDDTNKVSLSLSYDFRRWLTFKVGYGFESRDSNISNLSYDQNIYYFAIEGVM